MEFWCRSLVITMESSTKTLGGFLCEFLGQPTQNQRWLHQSTSQCRRAFHEVLRTQIFIKLWKQTTKTNKWNLFYLRMKDACRFFSQTQSLILLEFIKFSSIIVKYYGACFLLYKKTDIAFLFSLRQFLVELMFDFTCSHTYRMLCIWYFHLEYWLNSIHFIWLYFANRIVVV